jgi:hypothetical protein
VLSAEGPIWLGFRSEMDQHWYDQRQNMVRLAANDWLVSNPHMVLTFVYPEVYKSDFRNG